MTITTPQVEITNLNKLQERLTIPNVVLQVEFEEGLQGTNILLINIKDASIIANLMMGGDGKDIHEELSEIEISAVSEAMNQMIGSASTSMATMLKRNISIYPPHTQVWDIEENLEIDKIQPDESIAKIAFRMTVEGLIDSEIMQLFTMDTVEDIIHIMMGGEEMENQGRIYDRGRIGRGRGCAHGPRYILRKNLHLKPNRYRLKPQFHELQNKPSNETLRILI